MAASSDKGPGAPAIVERFVKQLNITFKAVKLYPLTSSIPRDNARSTLEVLHRIMQNTADVRFGVTKDGLLYESLPVYPEHPAFVAFAREFYSRGLAEVRFHAGTTIDDVLRFLSVLDVPQPELASSGGFESRMWELGVNSITVRETSARIVEAADAAEPAEEQWPPESRTIDEIIAEALGRRPRSQRLLTRVIRDGEALTSYLGSPSSTFGGPQSFVVARRLSSLAHAVREEPPEERAELYGSLSASLRSLDPDLVREVLVQLLGSARHDDSLAGIVRAMPLEDVCASLISGVAFDSQAREELARTVRNLVTLGLASRQQTIGAVADALEEAGAPDDFRSLVLEAVAPSQLRVRERPSAEERPADVVLRLLDIAATNVAAGAEAQPGSGELAEEAARGITDGDVLGALVTLATVEDRATSFASLMSMLENNLGLLIERHDFDVAADAAESLQHAAQKPELTDEQRRRLRSATAQLGRPDCMRAVFAAMRVHPAGTPEHQACRRLLVSLGESTVGSLLEVLSEEKDMAARKALVDTIASLADRYIPILGERVSDSRWYFVRNIVSILGGTRDPAVLPYLERTLRHPDPRVRRETVRSLTGVRDALAGEMLIAALQDEDPGIVQLAARQLGTMQVRGAVPALEDVARGDGRGNRDMDTRIESIGALGRLGSTGSLPVLETILRQRVPLRAGRTRELKAAAEAAARAIRARGGAA